MRKLMNLAFALTASLLISLTVPTFVMADEITDAAVSQEALEAQAAQAALLLQAAQQAQAAQLAELAKAAQAAQAAQQAQAAQAQKVQKAQAEAALKAAQEANAAQAAQALKEAQERQAAQAAAAVVPGEQGPSTYVDINLGAQTLTYFVNGSPALTTPCVTGSPGRSTPSGVFTISTKVPGKYLTGPTWHVWVNRWMRFTGNVGIHDASWRKSFGGNIYRSNGSHGCVNIPFAAADQLYNMVSVGTVVVVH